MLEVWAKPMHGVALVLPKCGFKESDRVLTERFVSCWGAAQVIAIVSRTDGTRAASIGTDGCLRLWDTATGDCLSNKVGYLSSAPARNPHICPGQQHHMRSEQLLAPKAAC